MLEKVTFANIPKVIKELQSRYVEVIAGSAIGTLLPSTKGVLENDTVESAILFSSGVPSDITSTVSPASVRATGTLTVAGVVAGDKVTVDTREFTAIIFDLNPSNTALGPNKFPVGSSDAVTASNLAQAIMASSDTVEGTASGAVVTLRARTGGLAGNAIALVTTAANGHITRSAATLAGGLAVGGFKSTVDTTSKQVVITWYDKA